ncbi:MAG: hypothetical protein F6K30_06515 [Cyanothece sp. SIO2G6]|nr:hypothetical protein [Cyanothece sp. SIO2G6]
MFFALTPDLSDGLMVIGLIATMSLIVCPLFMWVLTYDRSPEPGSNSNELQGKIS